MASPIEQELTLYKTVFDEIPDVIVLKDRNGNFLLCNQTLARLYNTTPEAMVGKHDDDFGVPREMAETFRRNVLDIMASGQTQIVFEDSRDASTGEIRHFKSIKRPFKDANGDNCILVIAHDITDVYNAQQRVAESERRYRDVMEATREGVWDWHVASGLVLHNAQWYEQLGYEEGEIADNVQAFSGCIHPDDMPAVWNRLQQLLTGQAPSYDSEHRMYCKDGSIIWVRDRGRIAERDAGGQPVRVVGAYVDITERKCSQERLEQALEAAQSATRAKSEFLATMSHEIRTPMNGILGMAQMLLTSDVSEQDRQEYARTILNSGQTLLTLLNDILDFSKVEAGRMELVRMPFDPRQLIAETRALFDELAAAKGLLIEAGSHGLLADSYSGDPIRLRQMLANYLSNAIKFTEHGKIVVEVRECDPVGSQAVLEFSVCDNGIGIAPEKQHQLFKPFSQADSSTTRKYGGTGLGLSIVSRLAALMGGEVGVDSDEGKGSRFWFRIQASRQSSGQERRQRQRQPQNIQGEATVGLPPAHLLVAEDNAINRKVIGALLGKLGMHVEFAENGQAAIDAIASGSNPDLILMDIQMPEVDGLEATAAIRRRERENDLPRRIIIALTAGAYEEDRQRCIDAGMDDFLAKPVNIDNLAQTLGRWLRK